MFGPLKCTASMSQLGDQDYKRGKHLLQYKDTVPIPSLGMIDDLLTASHCRVKVHLDPLPILVQFSQKLRDDRTKKFKIYFL